MRGYYFNDNRYLLFENNTYIITLLDEYGNEFYGVSLSPDDFEDKDSMFIISSDKLVLYNFDFALYLCLTYPLLKIDNNGKIIMKNLCISTSSRHLSCFIPFDSEYVRIDNVTFDCVHFRNNSLFSYDHVNTLSYRNIGFYCITRSFGNGSIFCITLNENQSMILGSIAFYYCGGYNTYGGSFYLTFSRPEQISFTNISFYNDKRIQCGYLYYIICDDINRTAHYLIEICSKMVYESYDIYKAYGSENDTEIGKPLYLFLLQKPEIMVVNNYGGEDKVCGFDDYPCTSLIQGFLNKNN